MHRRPTTQPAAFPPDPTPLPHPGKKGGGGKAKEQCLFLPYVDAVSVVVSGKENARPAAQATAQAAAAAAQGGAGGGLPMVGAEEGEELRCVGAA